MMTMTSNLSNNWDSQISNCHLKTKLRELMLDWDDRNQQQVDNTGDKPPLWLRSEKNKQQNKNFRENVCQSTG